MVEWLSARLKHDTIQDLSLEAVHKDCCRTALGDWVMQISIGNLILQI